MFHIAPDQMALYVHWPFCKAKCPYCDFNSHVASTIDHAAWRDAYTKEMAYYARELPKRELSSIFFGGGTPSLMEPETVAKVIEEAHKHWRFAPNIEITLEANPTSTEAGKFKAFRSAGVNRLSLGIQSLIETDLKFLGREHDVKEARAAIELAASIFENYSFDLIYARPGQTAESWEKELKTALALAAKHISLYQLTIEKGTPFYSQYQQKQFQLPQEDLAIDLYEMTKDIVGEKGMVDYEVSNYALPGYESKHNLAYWQYGEYLGIGPGAHSRLKHAEGRRALLMQHRPDLWLSSVAEKSQGLQSEEIVNGESLKAEFLMMGLRLKEGIRREKIRRMFHADAVEWLGAKLQNLKLQGLLVLDEEYLRATDKGRMLLTRVIEQLVD
ncbi:MAG: coproporphyrinogen III oxidase [Proteobacteria bacterium]|nr:coproporphyrinogen III oxidase [Pseudomonadota bacterium]